MVNTVIVIGANAAGANSAIAARRTNREAEIVLITDEGTAAYSRCGLPYVLAGKIPRFWDLVSFPPNYFRRMRIDLRTRTSVESIDLHEKTVNIIYEDRRAESIPFDTVVIATGATPTVPANKGYNKQGVYSLRTLQDGERIREAIPKAEKVTVVGSGWIGLQMAYAFAEIGKDTTIIESAPYMMAENLDYDMAKLVQKRAEETGVKLVIGQAIEEITGNNRVSGVSVGGKNIDADMVVTTTGTIPRSDLAQHIGCNLGLSNAIKVDCQMQTSIQGVYAAGDCVETQNMITGLPVLANLGTVAVRGGRIAGINAAGGYSIFPGVLCSSVSRVFDFEIGATGLTENQAKEVGLPIASAILNAKTKPEYFPGAKEISVKIVVEKDSERVIGGQVIGGEDVAQRINMIALAIQSKATVWELSKVDTCYAPPVSEMWESTALTADLVNLLLKES